MPPRAPVPRGSQRRHRVTSANSCSSDLACPAPSQDPVAPSTPLPSPAAHSRPGFLTWPGWLLALHSTKAWTHKGRVGAVRAKGSPRSGQLCRGRFPNAHLLLTPGAGRSLGAGEDVVSRTSAWRLDPRGPRPCLPTSVHGLVSRRRISVFFLFLIFTFLRKTKPKHIPACAAPSACRRICVSDGVSASVRQEAPSGGAPGGSSRVTLLTPLSAHVFLLGREHGA